MSKRYGDNLNWFLAEVASADSDQIVDAEIEIHGETESGGDACSTIDLRELCASALAKISELEGKNSL
jgi:hypothetical protein